MAKNKVFQVEQCEDLPTGVKPIDSIWACKKKSKRLQEIKPRTLILQAPKTRLLGKPWPKEK